MKAQWPPWAPRSSKRSRPKCLIAWARGLTFGLNDLGTKRDTAFGDDPAELYRWPPRGVDTNHYGSCRYGWLACGICRPDFVPRRGEITALTGAVASVFSEAEGVPYAVCFMGDYCGVLDGSYGVVKGSIWWSSCLMQMVVLGSVG